jgi:hypothetical protein
LPVTGKGWGHSILEGDTMSDLSSPTEISASDLRSVPSGPFPPYYPAIDQDFLWNVTDENDAHQWLVGGSLRGQNLVEAYLSGPLFDKLVKTHNWLVSASRGLKYFLQVTAPARDKNHLLHREFRELLSRLETIPTYQRVHEAALSDHITVRSRLDSSGNLQYPFYACSVPLPFPIGDHSDITLESWIDLAVRDVNDVAARRYYHVTLRPETAHDEALLILLHLSRSHSVLELAGITPPEQLLWGLAMLRTVREGVELRGSDARWDPISAFREKSERVAEEFRGPDEDWVARFYFEVKTELGGLLRSVYPKSGEGVFRVLLALRSERGLFENFVQVELDSYLELRSIANSEWSFAKTDDLAPADEQPGFAMAEVPDLLFRDVLSGT